MLMASLFVIAGAVSVVFVLFKFLEMRYVEKESKPLKVFVKDGLFVYFSVLLGSGIIQQIYSSVSGGGPSAPQVFTDNPSF